jgi:NADH-quinone oxidoreductase subunit F
MRINEALEQCRRRGFLGERIMGADFRLDLSIKEGAGAFVCGEETAMLASIEGRRGMPRLRPPFPAESGLWQKPTLINNVETYSLVPWILRNGADAFAKLGTPTSAGTKVFALAGKIRRGGLIEVPMGVTVRQIVEDIGGGVSGSSPGNIGGNRCPGMPNRSGQPRQFKAVQVGGPSGGCVPAELADTPIDYEALAKVAACSTSSTASAKVTESLATLMTWSSWPTPFAQGASADWVAPRRIPCSRH